MDKEYARRRQAQRDDQSQLNLALRAQQHVKKHQWLPDKDTSTQNSFSNRAKFVLDHNNKSKIIDNDNGKVTENGTNMTMTSHFQYKDDDANISTRHLNDKDVLGETWSVHRTRIVSVCRSNYF